MKTLIKYQDAFHLNEIFQAMNIKFAFINDKYEQVTSPAKCRDFLGDCIWSYKTGLKASIYGFNYSFKDKPYDLETLRLSLKFPNKMSKNYFLLNIYKLKDKELDIGLSPSDIFNVEGDEDTIIIEADKEWQESSWKISLFTYYLKILSYKDETKLAEPESDYIKVLTKEVEGRLLSHIHTPTTYVAPSISWQHNYTGFISVIKDKTMSVELTHLMAKKTV